MRSRQIDIRIGPAAIAAQVRDSRGLMAHHHVIDEAGMAAGLSQLLGQIRRRPSVISPPSLVSPNVCVSVAGPEVRTGVIRFDALPRKAADRTLIVTQRFCRDHKLDAKSTAVAFSVHAPAEGGLITVLACAMPRIMLDVLTSTVAAHGLYCDLITSDVSLALAGLDAKSTTGPGMLAITADHACTLLVLGAGAQPQSVVTLTETDGGTLAARLVARLLRYVSHFNTEAAHFTCHLYDTTGVGASLAAALRGTGSPVHVVVGGETARAAA